MTWLYRHRLSWDLTGVTDRTHRAMLQEALNACSYPFSRIRRRTGKRVPVTASDLSRFDEDLEANGAHGHAHSETGELGHLLGEPGRHAALGLYWLPTAVYPAGRVELDFGVFRTPALAREVFLAEGAHAVDYGAMVDSQRTRVLALFDYTGTMPTTPQGWFEEQGEEDYWRWRGERWMGLFMATYAPGLPRLLEPRQPWQWGYDSTDIAAVKAILR